MSERVRICFFYAHEDEVLKDELEKRLSMLQHMGVISAWSSINVNKFLERKEEIDLNNANIVLLLVSPDLLASDYCSSIQVQEMVRRN